VLGTWAAPLDFEKRGLHQVLRASAHAGTPDTDIELGAAVINQYISTLTD